MKTTKTLIAILTLTFLAGCATTYQPSSWTGGLDEIQLSENVYQIYFNGNGYTSQQIASMFLLRRCAELTLLRNGLYFEILGDGATNSTTGGGMFGVVSRPSGNIRVRVLKAKTENSSDAFLVIDQTDAAADGKLTLHARAIMKAIRQQQDVRYVHIGKNGSEIWTAKPDGSRVRAMPEKGN